MIAEFALTVLYTQIVVHVPGLDRPGLLWSDEHVAQGFAWSPGIASFGVPDHDGQCLLQVDIVARSTVDPAALWAVQTPFQTSAASLAIGTIGDMHDVSVPAGVYNLVFQAMPNGEGTGEDYAFVLRLEFVGTTHPEFAILKQGQELTAGKVLRRDAERV